MWSGFLGGRKAVRSGGFVRLVSVCVLILDSCRWMIDAAPLWFTISLLYIWNRASEQGRCGCMTRSIGNKNTANVIASPRTKKMERSEIQHCAFSLSVHLLPQKEKEKDPGARKISHVDTGLFYITIFNSYKYTFVLFFCPFILGELCSDNGLLPHLHLHFTSILTFLVFYT